MKRALVLGLGSLMAVGSAAPASAAAHIDFTGYYRLMYMNESNTSHGREPASFTDAYFQDRLNLELTFSPTDEIAVHWRLRGPDYQRWGSGGGHELETHYIYAEIKQGWGTVLVGRLNDDLDVYGLASLGYQPSTIDVFTNTGPFDRADVLDGFRYAHTWDNGFSLMAQYGKISNNKQYGGPTSEDIIKGYSDHDRDQYRVEAAYAWDGGGASLGLFYDRTATSNLIPGCGILYSVPIIIDSQAEAAMANMYRFEQWGLNPAIMHSWGDFSFHFEGMAQWGKAKYITGNTVRDKSGHRVKGPSQDAEGFGAYLDLDYNYGPGNITLAAWWVSGSGLEEHYKSGGKNRSIADLVGGNFYPLLVAYNGSNLNPGDNRYAVGTDDPSGRDGHEAGRHVSAIGFANNGYINYVQDGQLGRTAPGKYGNISGTGAAGNYSIGTGTGAYYAINDVKGVNLNPNGAGGSTGIFHRDVLTANTSINRVRTLSFNEFTDANHWAVALTGNHAFTDDITMHYGLAYLALNKPNYRVSNGAVYSLNSFNGGKGWTNTSYTTQDKDLGFEIDLGFTFQLLDNLKFTTAFGYMFNGDAYKQFKGYELIQANPGANALVDGDVVRGRWADADDSYVWFNSLTFAF